MHQKQIDGVERSRDLEEDEKQIELGDINTDQVIEDICYGNLLGHSIKY